MNEQRRIDSLREIAVDQIQRASAELRQSGSEAGMDDLRSSIAAHGVLVPIIVAETDIGYRLVAGKRRLLCAAALGLATVPAIVVPADPEWEAWAMSAENRVRESIGPTDEAEWLARQLEQRSCSAAALAGILGVSPSYVSQRLSCLTWPEDIREALASRLISFSYRHAPPPNLNLLLIVGSFAAPDTPAAAFGGRLRLQ